MNHNIKADKINIFSESDKIEEVDNTMPYLSKQTSTQTSASLNPTSLDNMTSSVNDANCDEEASNSILESNFQVEDPWSSFSHPPCVQRAYMYQNIQN